MYIKLEKCVWKTKKIGFLGVIIGPNGIEMEAEKVDGVLSQPQPKNVKDIRKFLGLANYYRRFIKDFARVVKPMNILSQTSFGHISINSSSILTVSMATESP